MTLLVQPESLQWLCSDCPPQRHYNLPPIRKKLPHMRQHCPQTARATHILDMDNRGICRVTTDDIRVVSASARRGAPFPPNNYAETKIKEYTNHWQFPFPVNRGVRINSHLSHDTVNTLKFFTGLRNISVGNSDARNFCIQTQVATNNQSPTEQQWFQTLREIVDSTIAPIVKDKSVEAIFRKRRCPAAVVRPHTSRASSRGLYSASSGRLLSAPCTSRSRRSGTRSSRCPSAVTVDMADPTEADSLHSQVFFLLGGVLQTQDPAVVKSWLLSATDREKALVCDIVRSALTDEEELTHFVQEASKEPSSKIEIITHQSPITVLQTIPENEPAEVDLPLDRLVINAEKFCTPQPLPKTSTTFRPVSTNGEAKGGVLSRPSTATRDWLPAESVVQ